MASKDLQAESAANNSPIVAAFLRAFELDQEHRDGSADCPDTQFAWAAMEGAKQRVLECGISDLDHVAAIALIVLSEIDLVVDGHSIFSNGGTMVPVEDLKRGLWTSKQALKGIWQFAVEGGGAPVRSLKPFARYCGAEAI